MRITGIGGDLVYEGHSRFLLRDKANQLMLPRRFKHVGMIAGGSGIAPMFQLIQTVSDLHDDHTSLSLIYSNRTPVSFRASLSQNLFYSLT
jgi:ferredoxin-NADP reductase